MPLFSSALQLGRDGVALLSDLLYGLYLEFFGITFARHGHLLVSAVVTLLGVY